MFNESESVSYAQYILHNNYRIIANYVHAIVICAKVIRIRLEKSLVDARIYAA